MEIVRVSLPTVRELDRARTPKSKVRVWSLSLDPIDSIGQLLSITVGRNIPLEGIPNMFSQHSKVNNLECELLLLRSNLFSQKAINAPIQPHTSLISPEKRMDDQPKAPSTGKILPKTNQRFL